MRRWWRVRFEFKPADAWLGAFWDRREDGLHVWICLIPAVPLHLHRPSQESGGE